MSVAMLAWAYSMKRIIGLLGLAQKTARPVMAEPYCRVVVSWLTNIQADWAVGLAFEACLAAFEGGKLLSFSTLLRNATMNSLHFLK